MRSGYLILFTFSVVAFCGCATSVQRASRAVVVTKLEAVLPAEENDRSAWLAAHIDTHESKFTSQTTRDWKQSYEVFGKALVKKAAGCGFDSESLSKVLKLILAEISGQPLAYVPIAAHLAEFQGEPMWIVVVHWEECFGPEDPIPIRPLSHVRTYAFTQNGPKQVAFLTCR